MVKFKNVSPLGVLYLPLAGRDIAPEESFELTEENAVFLDGQDANFERVIAPATKAVKEPAA
jgi:hypothetical protein